MGRIGRFAAGIRIVPIARKDKMTRHLTPDDFDAAGAAVFTVRSGDVAAELSLAGLRRIEGSPRAGGGFALTFRGPSGALLPQATYRLAGGGLEADIFIVPVGRDASGSVYEAIFN